MVAASERSGSGSGGSSASELSRYTILPIASPPLSSWSHLFPLSQFLLVLAFPFPACVILHLLSLALALLVCMM